MWRRRVVVAVFGCALVGAVASAGAEDTTRDAGAGKRGVAPPPPITVLPVFEWVVEETGGTRTVKTELFIYSSGMAVLVSPVRALGRLQARTDDGSTARPRERLVRRQISRDAVVGLLKTLEEARFRSFPERFVAATRAGERGALVRATLRVAERTIGVSCEPPGDDRTARAAPAGWAVIEKAVRSILILLKPKAVEDDERAR